MHAQHQDLGSALWVLQSGDVEVVVRQCSFRTWGRGPATYAPLHRVAKRNPSGRRQSSSVKFS